MRFNLYPVLRPLVTLLFKFLYRPKIINKELIPKTGSIILAGNHKHAFDPLFIGVCTKRTIHFLAKKELYKGINFLFFDLIFACSPKFLLSSLGTPLSMELLVALAGTGAPGLEDDLAVGMGVSILTFQGIGTRYVLSNMMFLSMLTKCFWGQ